MVNASNKYMHFQLQKSMAAVKKILDLTRTPRYAEEEDHVYEDKFGLAEFLTNSAIAAQVNAYERMGIDEEKLSKLANYVHNEKRAVTLRFALEENCTFLEEKTVEIEIPNEVSVEVTETKSNGKNKSSMFKRRVVTKVKEYNWQFGIHYKIFAFAGSDPEVDPVIFKSGSSSTKIITTGNKKAPVQERNVLPPVDVSITWLLQNLMQEGLKCDFHIDRSNEETRTPRRNKDIDEAYEFFAHSIFWCDEIVRTFVGHIEPILGMHQPAKPDSTTGILQKSLSSIDADEVFVPVLALMEKRDDITGTQKEEDKDSSSNNGIVSLCETGNEDSPILSLGDINLFLSEQCRSLDNAIASLNASYPSATKGKLLGSTEATLVMCCMHIKNVAVHLKFGVDYIEQMLHDQMVSAIGKEVDQKDFEEFTRFHNKRIFNSQYAPKPFCYAIRRPNHFPDGVLSIETNDEPIETIVRKISGEESPPMYFPINAAVSVEFTGERYLHAWVRHRFASGSNPALNLIARARQFSSFLLMAGTITGPDSFEPRDAIILQNKDEVLIPILLNELPTAKEFKDAISSLSPEQQRFAKAFRSMQLESSVFGVCVVQLKPQLEKLLGLPPDALTKEIGLTQDLLSLFIDYQIPSDLLSFDGLLDASVSQKVDAVKNYVKSVQAVIDSEKAKKLEEEVQKADMRAELSFGSSACQRSRRAPANFVSAFGSSSAVPSPQLAPQAGFEPPRPLKRMVKCAPAQQLRNLEKSPDVSGPEFLSLEDDCLSAYSDASLEEENFDFMNDNAKENTSNNEASKKPGIELPGDSASDAVVDFTAIPKKLDVTFEQHDKDNALRTTKLKLGDTWTRMRQENLLVKVSKSILQKSTQKTEKDKAFDLLDALSRSGSLAIACAELHVILGVTHCFEKSVMETVIEDNTNPIEKIDRSMFMIASTIHNVGVNKLMEGAPEEKLLRLGTDTLLVS